MKKTLLILPTLNEVKNIQKLYILINKLKLDFTYLFIDHGSTDGTQEIIKKLKKKTRLKILSFKKKSERELAKLIKMV